MSVRLASFYDAFLDAVVDGRPDALGQFLEDDAAAANAIIYRNTVFRGGAEALSTAYPAVARLAGAAYFEAVAVEYVAACPPTQRSLVSYGDSFPDFLETAPGVEHAPYLPDAARLDRAWLMAHRARSGPALTARELAAVPPDRIADLRLHLHPSVRVVDLGWSMHEAWKANRQGRAGDHAAHTVNRAGQSVLIWRLDHEVESQTLTPSEAAFFNAIDQRRSLADAAADALGITPSFDTSLVFAGAIEAGVFEHLDLADRREHEY